MNVRLKRDFHFIAGIYYNGQVTMNNYSLRLWIVTNSLDPNDHNTAFERIKYYIYNEVDNTVFVNSKHTEQCEKLVSAGFKITTLPEDPVDQLVGIMLFYKLNAITENRMIIVETELASVLGDNMTYLHSEEENSDSLHKPDWWTTPDLTHCNLILPNTDKVVSMHQTTTWRDLDLTWNDQSISDPSDNTVVFAKFKPDDAR